MVNKIIKTKIMKTQKQFYPSNGTEGALFELNNCDNCYKRSGCTIKRNAYFGVKPKQWIYNSENKPICTSLQKNRPKAKSKRDPNELTLF